VTNIDFRDIDDVIHGRVRLAIMTYLASNELADFNELKDALQATQGNLGAHIRKLEEAGYIKVTKGYVGRKPNTRLEITTKGRKAFVGYLDAIEKLLGSVR
jgi:DNA-binding MarR family transcriptional regulator